ncbi:MAG TPA: sigma-54-dependent Fis family transcriptional regulator [Campylobacterales bacterium]|nr:sigma-54-dependent Fis family transcriptional regulator [Campylobacterales bacterium]
MKIAIVEDDISMRKSLEIALTEYKEFEVTTFKNATDALKKLDSSYQLIVTDINMPKIDGIEFIKQIDFKTNFIIMTGNATLNRAVESMRLGVKDFLTKPFEIETLVEAIKRSAEIAKVEAEYERRYEGKDRRVGLPDTRLVKSERRKPRSDRRKHFYGYSQKLEKILNLVEKAAKTDASVMLLGESGVGKELFAKEVHYLSPRYAQPFIPINMAAIPDNLLESELFGYEKGAFTDATAMKKGLFETAHKGTLFLDEIGEMPLALQAKLLRVLQEHEIYRVGGTKAIKIDVRIVSATNANILEQIENKKFREDLYYRLNTIPVKIPPLRERKEEIEDIAKERLYKVCRKYDFEHKSLSDDALKALYDYAWPGNIRELFSVVERAAILSESDIIEAPDLFLESRKSQKSIKDLEKELIIELLKDFDNDLDKSAKALGVSRTNLNKKIDKYSIEV